MNDAIVIHQDDDSEFGDLLILGDAIGQERDSMCRPWLTFDPAEGRVTIADDYETVNDLTARDCILTKGDAIRLAAKLLDYAMNGKTAAEPCVSSLDVERRLDAERH